MNFMAVGEWKMLLYGRGLYSINEILDLAADGRTEYVVDSQSGRQCSQSVTFTWEEAQNQLWPHHQLWQEVRELSAGPRVAHCWVFALSWTKSNAPKIPQSVTCGRYQGMHPTSCSAFLSPHSNLVKIFSAALKSGENIPNMEEKSTVAPFYSTVCVLVPTTAFFTND